MPYKAQTFVMRDYFSEKILHVLLNLNVAKDLEEADTYILTKFKIKRGIFFLDHYEYEVDYT
jgi:hypothetical protein